MRSSRWEEEGDSHLSLINTMHTFTTVYTVAADHNLLMPTLRTGARLVDKLSTPPGPTVAVPIVRGASKSAWYTTH